MQSVTSFAPILLLLILLLILILRTKGKDQEQDQDHEQELLDFLVASNCASIGNAYCGISLASIKETA